MIRKLFFTFFDGFDEIAEESLRGFDGIVVAWDHATDVGGINVGVDYGEDWDAEDVGLFDGVLVFVGVEDDEGGGLLGHILDTAVALVQEINLLLETLHLELVVATLELA